MNIKAVRDCMKKFGALSLGQIAQEVGESKDELKFVLNDLVNRGRVEKVRPKSFCTGGCSCSSEKVSSCGVLEVEYKWKNVVD